MKELTVIEQRLIEEHRLTSVKQAVKILLGSNFGFRLESEMVQYVNGIRIDTDKGDPVKTLVLADKVEKAAVDQEVSYNPAEWQTMPALYPRKWLLRTVATLLYDLSDHVLDVRHKCEQE